MANTPTKTKKPAAANYDPVAEWNKQQEAKKQIENRRGEKRYPFTASAEIVDLNTQVKIEARTSDLSAGGCYVDSMNPLALGTHVKIKLIHRKNTFEAVGRVNYSQSGVGMGLAFVEVDDEQRTVLGFWLAEASGAPAPMGVLPQATESETEEAPSHDLVLAKLIALLIRYGHISEDEGNKLLRELRG